MYLDTSAFVRLLLDDEENGQAMVELWHAREAALASELLFPEAAAAIARARRMKRLSAPREAALHKKLTALWEWIRPVDLGWPIFEEAAGLARKEISPVRMPFTFPPLRLRAL